MEYGEYKAIEDFIAESNRIENIHVPVKDEDVKIFKELLGHTIITVLDLCNFVEYFQPGAELRHKKGMNVVIQNGKGQILHKPIPGGPEVQDELIEILYKANNNAMSPFEIHQWYETLHPFMDGNGRSGRFLWAWMMKSVPPQGFLHIWYYQSLQEWRKK